MHSTTYYVLINTDLVGASACERVYPEVRQILCRWHVDKYVHSIFCQVNYCTSMYCRILSCN